MQSVLLRGKHQKPAGRFWARLGALVIVLAAASAAYAQSFTGLINGTVTDQAGAALANASVTLRAEATGQMRSTMTNDQGEYTFPNDLC